MNIVLSSGFVGGGNSYLRIQDIPLEQLISATHVDVQVYQGGEDRLWTGVFVPKGHSLESLGKESELVTEGRVSL
jgi:hypothetical protein